MNIDSGILHAMLECGGFIDRIQLMKIDATDLEEPGAKRAFDWVVDYYTSQKMLPAKATVEDVCRYAIEDQGVTPEYLASEIIRRRLFNQIATLSKSVGEDLRSNNPEAALDRLRGFSNSHVLVGAPRIPDSIFSFGDQVLETYTNVKNGYSGIPIPWPTLNATMMGLWPGTCTYFVARPGVGKTWVLIVCANHIWNESYRTLIVSPEMSKAEMAERLFTIRAQVSSNNVLRGTLPDFELSKLEKSIQACKSEEGLYIVDYSDDLSEYGLESYVEHVKPDVVLIDSVYMLNFKGDKSERTQKAVEWMRQAAKRHNIPIVGFHQLNRAATQDKKHGGAGYSSSAIALTDQILWDAHCVFIMEQDDDMKIDKTLRFNVGKVRRGNWNGLPIDVNWDFDRMNFEELIRKT